MLLLPKSLFSRAFTSFLLVIFISYYACLIADAEEVSRQSSVDSIRRQLLIPDSPYVLVVAHRGDWRHAPENSLRAIQNCIEMGVDIVELDVCRTSDGEFIIMHDDTLDRTTSGSGLVSEHSLADIKKLYLKNGQGCHTRHRVPTLREAMLTAKGKIMVNLDKSYWFFEEFFPILVETDTIDHIVIKGRVSVDQVRKDFGPLLDQVVYMPILNLDEENSLSQVNSFQSELNPAAFELLFDTSTIDLKSEFTRIRKSGSRVWVNTLWPYMNAGHDDDRAVDDPDGTYGWLLNCGVNIIQTDRPRLLLNYLSQREVRDRSQP